MTRKHYGLMRLANWLVTQALRIMPIERQVWAEAMLRELDEIKNPRRALRWAVGCVLASLTERLYAMNSVDLRVSNWVLSLEALLCFAPLTLLWIASILNMGRLSNGVLFGVALSTFAPLSLLFTFRFVTTGRQLNHKWHTAFACGFVLIGLLQIAAKLDVQSLRSTGFRVDAGLLLLLSILPALCSFHLAHLARHKALTPTKL